MATGFKKRAVSPDQVAVVEAVTASVPLGGDPRAASDGPGMKVGASQDLGQERLPSSTAFELVKPIGISEYEVGRICDIPVGSIKSNPYNPRAVYTVSAVDDMAASLAASGQRISATAYVDEAGEVVLIEGETRLRGARAAGLPTLRVEIRPRPQSDRELYEEARAANVERREQTPLDDALKWKELLAKKVYPTQVALAKALGIGEDHVSRTLSLANMPNRMIHTVAEYPDLLNSKMLNALREYWEITGDDATFDLIHEVSRTGMGYRDVVARRKAAGKGPVKRPRSVRESLTFQGAKGELRSFEEDGRLELSLKGLAPDAAQLLTAQLLALFPKPSA